MRGGEIRVGLREPDLVLGVVDVDELGAFLHAVVLADAHGGDEAADFRQHGHEVPVDLGVLGRLVRAAVAPFANAPDDTDEGDDTQEREDDELATRWLWRHGGGGGFHAKTGLVGRLFQDCGSHGSGFVRRVLSFRSLRSK